MNDWLSKTDKIKSSFFLLKVWSIRSFLYQLAREIFRQFDIDQIFYKAPISFMLVTN